jgi:hypothetical protein
VLAQAMPGASRAMLWGRPPAVVPSPTPPASQPAAILLVPSEMDPWRDRGLGLFGLPRTSLPLETPQGMLHACSVSCWVHARPQPLRSSSIQAPFCAEGLKWTLVHVTGWDSCNPDSACHSFFESIHVRYVENVPFQDGVFRAKTGNH